MSTRLSLARLRLLGPVLLHGPQALLRLCDYLVARDRGWPSGLAWLLAILAWFTYTGVRALWARVLPPCQPGPTLSVARLMCGSVVLTVSSAESLLLMLMSACALSGADLLTAFFVEVG